MARVHHRDPPRHPGHDPQIVADQQDRGPALDGELVEQFEHLGLHRDVEGGGRLVGDQQRRAERQRDRDQHALAHAAAELVRVAAQLVARPGDADGAQQFGGPAPRLAPAHVLVGLDRLGDLLADGQHGVQPAHRVLRDQRDLLATETAHVFIVELDQVAPAEPDLARDPRRVPREEAEDGQAGHALARAGLPHQPERAAGLQLEAHPVHGVHDVPAAVEAHGEVPDAQHRVARRRLRVAVRAHSCSPPMLPRSRGSIQSRRPSPSRLNPSTVSASAIPANVDHHQAVWM